MDPASPPPPPSSGAHGPLARLALGLGMAVGALLALEGLASVWLAAEDVPTQAGLAERRHGRYDETLGWSHAPGTHVADLYGPGRSITINSQGLRASRDYAPDVPPGRYRVVCLGDSFTMGYGVDDADTYPAQLERLCPTIEAVNMGMGGYGLDQALLWYERDGATLRADMLVLAFIDADVFRTELDAFGGYPKPRFEVRDGALVLTNVPVPRVEGGPSAGRSLDRFVSGLALARLLRHDDPAAAPSAGSDDEDAAGSPSVAMLDRVERILDRILALAAERGQRVQLLYLPTKRLAYFRQRSTFSRWIEDYARRAGVPWLDVQPTFENFPPSELASRVYLPDNHFDVRGNGIVAERLLAAIRNSVRDFPGCGPGR